MARPMVEGEELALFRVHLYVAERRNDDLAAVFAAVPQSPGAIQASAVDDAWLAALNGNDGTV